MYINDIWKSERSLVELIDKENGMPINADDLLDRDDDALMTKIRQALFYADKSNMPKLVCAACHQPVLLRTRNNIANHKKTYHFAHFPNSADCPVKTSADDDMPDISMWGKTFAESEMHKDMMKKMFSALEKDNNFCDANKRERIVDPDDPHKYMIPDISALFNGRKCAMEFQICNTFLSRIFMKNAFHKKIQMCLLWIFPYFDVFDQKVCENDITYSHKRNVLVFDCQEYYENKLGVRRKLPPSQAKNYVYAQDETFRTNKIHFNCYWQTPKIDENNKVNIEWHHKLISIDDLVFDYENGEVYYHNSDIDFYNCADSKTQQLIDGWQIAIENRWNKIFNEYENRRERIAEHKRNIDHHYDLKLALERYQKGEAYIVSYEEHGKWGFKIDDMILVPAKYSEVKDYKQGVAFVRRASWGAIDILGRGVKGLKSNYKSLYEEPYWQNVGYVLTDNEGQKWLISFDGVVLSGPFKYYNQISDHMILHLYSGNCEEVNEKGEHLNEYKSVTIDNNIFLRVHDLENHLKIFMLIDSSVETIESYADNREMEVYVICKSIDGKQKYGVITYDKKVLLEYEFDLIKIIAGKYFVLYKDGKCGLFNRESRELLPMDYLQIDGTDSSSFLILTKRTSVGDLKGLFFISSEVSTECKYSSIGLCVDTFIVESNDKLGLIDSQDGSEILPVMYDTIETFDNNTKYLVSINGKYGLFDKNGNKKIEISYDAIKDDYNNILGKYYRAYIGDRFRLFIDDSLDATNQLYDSIEINKGIVTAQCGDKCFLLNRRGEIDIECDSFAFLDNSALKIVRNNKSGILLLRNNSMSVDCIYDNVILDQSDNGYKVIIGGKMGFVSKENKMCIPAEYDGITICKKGRAIVKYNGKLGAVRIEDGQTIINCEYQKCFYRDYGFFEIGINGKIGLTDINGQIIASCEYDEINKISNEYLRVKKNSHYGLISYSGKLILPVKYKNISVKETATKRLGSTKTRPIPIPKHKIMLLRNGHYFSLQDELRHQKTSDTISELGLEPGHIVSGRVKKIEKFGAIIELNSTASGLLHKNDITYSKMDNPCSLLSVGQNVKVVILKINEGKISFSMKLLEPSPWDSLTFSEGNIVHGVIENIAKYGLFISLQQGVIGLLHISAIPENMKDLSQFFHKGDYVDVIITSINKNNKRIELKMV